MTSKVLAEILTKYGGAERKEDTLRLADDVEANIFASVGEETLNIRRITEMELLHDILVVTTHKHDRYILGYEDVRALHFAQGGKKTGY